jgi:signal transduction histidine kinase
MKITQKLSAICTLTLTAVMILCSVLLISSTRSQMLSSAVSEALSSHSNMTERFHASAFRYLHDEVFASVENQLLNYSFKNAARGKAALFAGDHCVFNNCGFDPAEFLSPDIGPSPEAGLITVEGEHCIICGSRLKFTESGNSYSIYSVKDIGPLCENIKALSLKFLLICLTGGILGVAIIIMLLKISLKPLKTLKDASTRIAGGNYSERIEIRGHDEVTELACSFNRMADSVENKIQELTEAAGRQRMFASAVSHEFKTPLTAIALNADSLQNLCMSEDEQYDALEVIQRQCSWLEALVRKLLELMRLKETSDIKPCSVPELLEAVKESCTEILKENKVSLETDCAADKLPMDKDLMQSALVNLIKNAVKASKPGQTVRLKAYGRIIEVSDEGCGMSADELAHASEPFYMGDKSRSRAQGNLGLGLALVKETAACHNADLKIISEKDNGTTVKIIFR